MLRKLSQSIVEYKSGFRTKGSFAQNFAISLSGTALAQILGFIFTPFIARIYGPEIYGLFALFVSITNNIAPVATLQFPGGFVAAKGEYEFHNLIRITFLVLVFFTALIFLLTYFFKAPILDFFNANALIPFAFIIPVYIFFMGLDQILLGWNIRRKEFKRGAVGKIFSVITSKGLTVLWGIIVGPIPLGMIIGNLLIYPFESLIKLNRSIRKELHLFLNWPSWLSIKATFINFRIYPYYVTTGMIINNLSNQLPVYYFSVAFNQSTVGYFALASSLVMMPISIVVTSSTTVFLQKAAEVYHQQPEQLKGIVNLLYTRLFWLSLIPLVFFALLSEWAFVVIFGEEWKQAGVFASFLAMGAIFSVPANPLAVLFRIMHHERDNFFINLIFIGIKFAGLFWGIINENILFSVIGFSIAMMMGYVTQIFWLFGMVRLERTILIRDLVIVSLLFCLIMFIKL